MPESIIHKKVTVTGRVQGVFYRASTKEKALDLGLKGYVINQNDGSVYIEVEGSEELIDVFINWCRKGPQFAHVETIHVETGNLEGYNEFEIRRW